MYVPRNEPAIPVEGLPSKMPGTDQAKTRLSQTGAASNQEVLHSVDLTQVSGPLMASVLLGSRPGSTGENPTQRKRIIRCKRKHWSCPRNQQLKPCSPAPLVTTRPFQPTHPKGDIVLNFRRNTVRQVVQKVVSKL